MGGSSGSCSKMMHKGLPLGYLFSENFSILHFEKEVADFRGETRVYLHDRTEYRTEML